MTIGRLSWPGGRGSEGFSGRRFSFAPGLAALVLLGACEFQRQSGSDTPGVEDPAGRVAAEIQEMLGSSAASWNGGDLAGFLDDYRNSEELTFSGPTGVTRGWDDVRTRYLRSYWAPGVSRDSLRFEGIEVLPLGEEHALALGQYVLFRPEDNGAVASTGHFSLVLRKLDGRWKILHDHTSASPEEGGADGEEG